MMKLPTVVFLVALTIALIITRPACAGKVPDIFTDLPYDQAKAEADAENKPLLIFAASRLTGPSTHMDRTTWANPVLVDWIRANAIAVRLDIRRERTLQAELGIHDSPETLISLGDETLARHRGYTDAQTLLRDLGEPELAKQAEIHHEEQHSWRVDDSRRPTHSTLNRKAKMLTDEEDFKTALDAYVWLWRNKPKHFNVDASRATYLRSKDLLKLTMNYPPAMRQFRIYRNSIQRRLEEDTATHTDLSEWIMLNDAIDETENTIAWVIRVRHSKRFSTTFRFAKSQIHQTLTSWNRWELYGEIYPDPVKDVRDSLHLFLDFMKTTREDVQGDDQIHVVLDADIREMNRLIETSEFKENAEIYAACLAAHRDDEARQIEQIFHKLDKDGSLHILLVRQALRASAVRDWHLKMIDQAATMGTEREGLRKLVEQLLQTTTEDNAEAA